nr:hypothetical protein BaRGS_001594 [Batillaria attramentaria]
MKKRRQSQFPADGATTGPNIRRMSRLEPRGSIQYGGANRRMSYASRHSSGTISGLSWGALGGFKAQPKMANTYRMAPESSERFKAGTAERIMTGILESYLDGEKYDKTMCVSLSKSLSDVIKERMKDQGWSPRYKFVCVVTLGEAREQGLAVSSRCMWNTDTDSFASANYKKGNLFAVATLYALYFE